MNTVKTKTRNQRKYTNKTRKNIRHVETFSERIRRIRREMRQEMGLPEETEEERMEHFRRRMNMPIGISQGFPVTPEMLEQVEEIKRLFNL